MAISQITTHVADAQGRLLAQYQKPNFQGLVGAVASHAQTLENAMFSLLSAFDLSSATGAQLDVLARILGVSRYGLTDDQLRTLLYGIVSLNNGNATAETIVAVAKALFQTDQVFFSDGTSGKHQPQIARSKIVIGIGSSALPQAAQALAQTLLTQAVGAGIELVFVSRFQSGSAFAFAGPQAWVNGYASVATPSAGGSFGGV